MQSEAQDRQRRLALEGAANFRDLGGYDVGAGRRTRWGRLFRSDSLADLTDADLLLLRKLGLVSLIDFRLPFERARQPNRLPADAGIETVEISFVPEGTLEMMRGVVEGTLDEAAAERALIRNYRLMPLAHQREYARMFEHIEAAAGRPLLIHCTSGKDRTGFGAALILFALGASRDVVLEDFALSDRYRRDLTALFAPQTSPALLDVLMSAPPRFLEAALAAIDETYGSSEAYLDRALGLNDQRQARLRDWLTEEVV